jgi:hypothetical protein
MDKKYTIDQKTYQLIIQLCDLALKQGGLAIKPAVDYVLERFDAQDGGDNARAN